MIWAKQHNTQKPPLSAVHLRHLDQPAAATTPASAPAPTADAAAAAGPPPAISDDIIPLYSVGASLPR